MMLIGTSLGGCLKSIMVGQVSEDDVLLIIARTDCPEVSNLFSVIEKYYNNGNKYAGMPTNYDYSGLNLEDLKDLGLRLWERGKIHQPRRFGHYGSFIHPDMDTLWLEVNPIGVNKNKIVVDAYEKYKMLDALTKDE